MPSARAIKARNRQYYNSYAEGIRSRKRNNYQNDPQNKKDASRASYKADPNKAKETARKQYNNNPELHISRTVCNHLLLYSPIEKMHSRGYIYYTRIKAQVIDKDIHVHGDYRGDYKVITEQ